MTYSVIENFSGGIDRTRARYALEPGQLWDGKNGHITRGGDFEIRKEFVEKYSLPDGTFGMAGVGDNLYVFGSAADPGVPSGITYQRLIHPDGLAMTSILSLDLYDGKVYIAAEFSNGSVFHYYDGNLVTDQIEGVRRSGQTVDDWIALIVDSINDQQSDVTASFSDGVITLTHNTNNTPFSVSSVVEFSDESTSSLWAVVTQTQAAGASQPEIYTVDFQTSPFVVAGTSTTGAKEIAVSFNADRDGEIADPDLSSITLDAAWSSVTGTWVMVGPAAGGDATILTTKDVNGTWTERSNPLNDFLGAVVYLSWADRFVAVGSSGSALTCLTSDDDGVTWTSRTGSSTTKIQINAFIDSVRRRVWVTFTGGELHYSDDSGVTWTKHASTGADSFDMLSDGCAGDSGLVVVGHDQGDGERIWLHSADRGDTWTKYQSVGSDSFENRVIWVDFLSFYIAAQDDYPNNSTNNKIFTSVDGITWTERSHPLTSWPTALAHDGEKVYCIGYWGSSNKYEIASSDNGIDWTLEVSETGTVIADLAFGAFRTDMHGFPVNATVTIGAVTFGANGMQSPGSPIKTHERKLYWADVAYLRFSAVDDAIRQNIIDDAGAGFINMGTHQSGSSTIVGIGTYQDKLAIFSRRTVQIWNMEPDDDNNAPFQYLNSIGTYAGRSVTQFGEIDLFFLSDQGIRGIRARSGIDLASVNDIGIPIDALLKSWVESVGASVSAEAVGFVEPEDNRFWLAIGSRIFVFSYFPSKKVSAWTYYDLAVTPSEFVDLAGRTYMRSGNTIYLYGGDNNDTWFTGEVRASLPFMGFKKDDTTKMLEGADIAATGSWEVSVMLNPNATDEAEAVLLGTLTGVTWTQERNMAVGESTMFAPVFISQGGEYASLSKVALLYSAGDAKA